MVSNIQLAWLEKLNFADAIFTDRVGCENYTKVGKKKLFTIQSFACDRKICTFGVYFIVYHE